MVLRESLLRKFAVLLSLFVLTVATGLGVAIVFGEIQERQVGGPFRALTCAMTDLSRIERDLLALERAVAHAGFDTGSLRDEPDAARTLESLAATVAFARSSKRVEETIGNATLRQLVLLLEGAMATADESMANPGDPGARVRAAAATTKAREFVSVVESSVLVDASRAVAFGQELRRAQVYLLQAGMVCSALIAVLAILLIRNWVVRPVARLREATERITLGDLSHRVAVSGGDELADLTERVNTMAASIGSMQERMVERERLAAAGEMVRRLAHNIRNPLAGIRNLAELSRMRSDDEAGVRDRQTEIIRAVDRFNQWLVELLDATSPLTLRPDMHELRPWIEGVLESARPFATMRDIELVLDARDAPRSAVFDAYRLEHAIVAVLTNALQASPSSGRVEVEIARCEESFIDDAWRIEVRDQGPGIPSEIKDRIFEPYFTTKPDGNGIGLAVAKQVVSGHGGVIEFLTNSGRGSRCVVRIPAKPALLTPVGSPAENNRSAESSRRERVTRGEHSGHRRRAEPARDGAPGS